MEVPEFNLNAPVYTGGYGGQLSYQGQFENLGHQLVNKQAENSDAEDVEISKFNNINKKEFRQIFNFEENEKDKRQLKKDFKKILSIKKKQSEGRNNMDNSNDEYRKYVKFRHIIDYYLTSGNNFYEQLRQVDSQKIIETLLTGTR